MRARTWNAWTQFDLTDGTATRQERLDAAFADAFLQASHAAASGNCLPSTIGCTKQRSMDPSELRMERVDRLRTSICAGTYNLPAADLAQKLLQRMLGDFH